MIRPLHHRFLAAAGILLLTFAAPVLAVLSPPGDWYASIAKPSWNPPAWVFGPVWTTLYLMMATAAWLVWDREGWKRAFNSYLVQLVFNAAWSPLFFAAARIDWAFVDIVALWFAIATCILTFHRVHRLAAWLMAPYLAWVTFAAILNATLWAMNR